MATRLYVYSKPNVNKRGHISISIKCLIATQVISHYLASPVCGH